MTKEQNIKKEENFPKDPENITKDELHEHFDLDNDGRVSLEDYSEHIDYHCDNPEVLEDKIEQAKYDRGFKYKKGGETMSGVRVPEVEYADVSKTEDERREIIDKHRYAKSIGDTEMADEALEEYRMFCAIKGFKKGGLTAEKAKQMLEDGTAQGKKLTDKQKRYFGYIAGGGKGKYAEGGIIIKYEDVVKIKRPRRNKKDWGSLEGQKKIPQIVYYTKGKNKEDIYSAELVEEIKGKGYRVMRDQDYAKGGKTDSNDTYIDEFVDEDTGETVFIERSRSQDEKLKMTDAKSFLRRRRKSEIKAKKLQDKALSKRWDIRSLESELDDVRQTIKENLMETEQTAEPEGGPISNRLGLELEDLERRKIAILKLISVKTKELNKIESDLDRHELI